MRQRLEEALNRFGGAPAGPGCRRPETTPVNGLDQSSSLMVDKITTMPGAGLGERLGRLRDDELVALNRSLMVFLGLASGISLS